MGLWSIGSVTDYKNHRVAVLGGGSFGTAIANMIASNGYAVTLWLRSEVRAASIRDSRENSDYLPGYQPLNLMLHRPFRNVQLFE